MKPSATDSPVKRASNEPKCARKFKMVGKQLSSSLELRIFEDWPISSHPSVLSLQGQNLEVVGKQLPSLLELPLLRRLAHIFPSTNHLATSLSAPNSSQTCVSGKPKYARKFKMIGKLLPSCLELLLLWRLANIFPSIGRIATKPIAADSYQIRVFGKPRYALKFEVIGKELSSSWELRIFEDWPISPHPSVQSLRNQVLRICL
ncbi:hypothetical protein CVT26_011650 [Gymnopilus dilepis]|uniref:Uncharacterized protein n=1 Tax=Gymnopilus dilepis TaxID=231916 RepID=A0A409WZQ2_9AGAR|nr:hypothetical protein CVT26_011650 [Gymnopilus dilepis]